MIRADDSLTIEPSEFARMVAEEMKFEMSIILRKRAALEENKGKCPRCCYVNSDVSAIHGWIEWKVIFSFSHVLTIDMLLCSCRCEGQFKIAETASKRWDDDDDKTSNVWDGVPSDSENYRENIIGVKGRMSPGSYVSFICGVAINNIA